MPRRVEVEPPKRTGSVESWDVVEYPRSDRAPGFVIPAPRSPSDAAENVARQVGQEIGRIREVADAAAETVHYHGEVIVDYGTTLGELNENRVMPWAVPTVSGLFETINRRADPSFPLSSLLNPAGPITGSSSSARGGDDDTGHSHSAGSYAVAPAMATGWSDKDRGYFVFLTPAITRAYERLNFMVDAVSSPCEMGVAVYVVGTDRVFRRQVYVPTIGSSLSTGRALVNVEFDRWVANQGEYVVVAFYQYGSGNTRRLLGLTDTQRPLDTSIVYPPRIGARSNATGDGLPETVDGSSAVSFTADWFIPYVELSEAVGTLARTYHDRFDQGGYLERPWVTLTGQGPYAADGGVGVIRNLITGFNAGPRVSMYDSPVGTDRSAVEVVMGSMSSNSDHASWAVVRGTNNLRESVALWVMRDRVEVRRWSVGDIHDARGSSVVVAGVDRSLARWDRVTAVFDGESVTVSVNGAHLFTASGLGGFAAPRFRFLGIGFEKTTSGDIYPHRFEDWRAFDVVAGEDS